MATTEDDIQKLMAQYAGQSTTSTPSPSSPDHLENLYQQYGTNGKRPTVPVTPTFDPNNTQFVKSADPVGTMLNDVRSTYTRPGADPTAFLEMPHVLLSGAGHAVLGGWRGLYDLATGQGVDKAANDVSNMQSMAYQPKAGTDANAMAQKLASPDLPINWIPSLAQKAGDFTFDKTGSPTAATAVETLGNAIPMAFGGRVPGALRDSFGNLRTAVGSAVEPAAVRTTTAAPAAASNAPLTAVGSARRGYWEPPAVTPTGAGEPVTVPAGSASQTAATESNTPAFRQPVAPTPVFPQAAPVVASGELPAAEQAARADVLRRVGFDEARQSAITGNVNEASTDYQMSRATGTPEGLRMKQVLDNERDVLTRHADSIVDDTGGIQGSTRDQSVASARGNVILKPFDALKEWYDNSIKGLYDEAEQRGQGVPTDLSGFQTLANDGSELTNSDRINVAAGLKSYLNDKMKIVSPDGTITASVPQAEQVRQYLNEHWSPANSKLVGKLKDAIDDDVTKAAGDDVYSAARALRTERGHVLDDPKGISNLMDASGPNGINRKVGVSDVADTLVDMDPEHLRHIMDTLDAVPDEIKPLAEAAKANIQAHAAARLADVGTNFKEGWNQKGVGQAIRGNNQNLATIFRDRPDIMQKLGDLNDAGNILAKETGYKGAAAQAINLTGHVTSPALSHGGSAVGSVAGAIMSGGEPGVTAIGATAGRLGGEFIAKQLAKKAAVKNVEQRIQQLSQAPTP